jgi:hypothetical protein
VPERVSHALRHGAVQPLKLWTNCMWYLSCSQRCCWGFGSSGIWRRVVGLLVLDVSKGRNAGTTEARSQGGTSGCNAHSRNSQNIKDKHADQHAKIRTTPHRIFLLPLLNRRVRAHYVIKVFWYWKRCFLRICLHNTYKHMYNRALYTYRKLCTYAPAVEAAATTVFMVWLRAWNYWPNVTASRWMLN